MEMHDIRGLGHAIQSQSRPLILKFVCGRNVLIRSPFYLLQGIFYRLLLPLGLTTLNMHALKCKCPMSLYSLFPGLLFPITSFYLSIFFSLLSFGSTFMFYVHLS